MTEPTHELDDLIAEASADAVVRLFHAWRNRLPLRRGRDWSPEERQRMLAIEEAEGERLGALVAICADLNALIAAERLSASEPVDDALRRVGADPAVFVARWRAVPPPDEAAMRWVIGEYERAEREGTLIEGLSLGLGDRLALTDDDTVRCYDAVRQRLGTGFPTDWTEAARQRGLTIARAEAARKAAHGAIADAMTGATERFPEAATVEKALRRSGISVSELHARISALPPPDTAGLRWLVDELAAAEQRGTLPPPGR
jgi:hypothetical protein